MIWDGKVWKKQRFFGQARLPRLARPVSGLVGKVAVANSSNIPLCQVEGLDTRPLGGANS